MEPSDPYQVQLEQLFGGVPLASIRGGLDVQLLSRAHVALQGEPAGSGGRYGQWMTVFLYPRPVDPSAPTRLIDAHNSEPGRLLARGAAGEFWLELPARPAPEDPEAVEGTNDDQLGLGARQWLAFVLALVVAVGWGGLAIDPRGILDLCMLPLAGAFGVATLTTFATVLQRPLPLALLLAPALPGALLLASRAMRNRAELRRALAQAMRRAENYVWLALPAALSLELARHPVGGWDGRSIWLFAAKKIHFRHLLALSDAHFGPYAWGHPEYPLLFGSWGALFTRLGGAFSERLIGLAIAALGAALLAALWTLSRARMGRAAGSVFTLLIAAASWEWIVQGYQDGDVLMLVVGLALTRLDPVERRASAVLAGCAALLKQEGLLFAILTWMLVAVARPAPTLRARVRNTAREFAALLPFVAPGLAHVAWARSNALVNDFRGISWGRGLAESPSRLPFIGQFIGHNLLDLPFYREALAGLALVAILLAVERRRPSSKGLQLGLAGAACSAAMVGTFLVTPSDVGWHMRTAADRVFLHGTGLFLMAALLEFGGPASSPASG